MSACMGGSPSEACAYLAKEIKNPYYLGDEVGLTQTLGWVGAWTSRSSVYAVVRQNRLLTWPQAVNFARTHNLRLVIRGGGHSYQGTSNAADSLLIWTRPMEAVVLHDALRRLPTAKDRRLSRRRRFQSKLAQSGDASIKR